MSWKLAELRWRQDVGLQESFFDRNNKTKHNHSDKSPEDNGRPCNTGRFRSHTAPWSRNAHQDNPQAYVSQTSSVLSPLLSADQIRPDPDVSAFSPTISICSTTPLLKFAPYVPSTGVGVASTIDNDKLPDDLRPLYHNLQTPIRPIAHPACLSSSRRTRLHQRNSSFSQACSVAREVFPPFIGESPPKTRLNHGTDSLPLLGRRVSAGSLHKAVKQQPATPLGQPLGGYQLDIDVPDLFNFPASPSFGLHFDLQAGNATVQERRNRSYKSCRSSRCRSLSPSILRLSMESRHHSDSCLLQRYKMDSSEEFSSYRSNNSRPLYPDLRSAYAQIQGRRVASQTRSSGAETRFPLSPSSSSDEDDYFGKTSSPANDAIPLRELPCRRVPSALGVIHVAEAHHESSAILESFDDVAALGLAGRRSCTVDDIVSQYADLTTDDSPFTHHCSSRGDFGPVTPGLPTWDSRNLAVPRVDTMSASLDATGGHTEQDAFAREKSLSELYLHERQVPTLDSLGDLEGVIEEDEWESLPDNSRTGFLNPSGLRFRLTKRETGDSSHTSMSSRKIPATPWDPLAIASKQTTYRAGLRRDSRSYHQDHLSPTQPSTRDKLMKEGCLSPVQTQSYFPAAQENLWRARPIHRLNSASTYDQSRQNSHLVICSPSPDFTQRPSLKDNSSYPSTSSSSCINDRTLPSSSLLPKRLDKSSVRTPSSPGTISEPTASFIPHNIPGLGSDTDTGANHFRNNPSNRNGSATDLTSRQARPTVSGLIDMIASAMEDTAPSGSCTYNTQTHSDLNNESLLRGRFIHGGYTTNDGDVSRFLRDSRDLRQGRLEDEVRNTLCDRAGVKTTGSSLANYSSDGLPLHRTASNDQAALTGTQINDDDSWQAGDLLNAKKNRRTSSHASDRTFSSRFTNTSPTTSMLSAEFNARFTPEDVPIDMDHCPSFPLTPAQLSIIRLEGIGRVPFERLQVLENGDWLEKAWCFVHHRVELSHARLVERKAGVVAAGAVEIQREAGRFLLVVSVATYMVGGFVLAHDMGKGGVLSSAAMAALTGGSVSRVHPVDIRLAQAIEKGGLLVVCCVLAGCVGVLVWSATIWGGR
ncbi:hypothetical protein LTR47_000397 [Exophiala xenobiotica]|nr:hypothetical protein LTR41_004173 [Exophiala xenobiotica]KAK5238654.1 hypothetical protein LTR47_000397 [Exophiala xenobiotica]KAK5255574.1 hypothetical protein LTS06_000030 [Exophiala xenobiotica]KAK5315061.1 hypothetical protein LTR93_010063 [Exophiala xenobiotica]KAK5350082.1 hypothetical protein LTR61_006057 [Exophiala xenobiotica]